MQHMQNLTVRKIRVCAGWTVHPCIEFVIFHIKCDLQHDLVLVFPSFCFGIHINITTLCNSCLLSLLSFRPGVMVLNVVELPLCKTTAKRNCSPSALFFILRLPSGCYLKKHILEDSL